MIATEKMFFYTALKRRGHGTPWGSHVGEAGSVWKQKEQGENTGKTFSIVFTEKNEQGRE